MNGSLAVAFTWSPDPSKFSGIRPEYQFNDTLVFIKSMASCCYYEIFPELNLSGNIHYHGKIYVYDKVKWYKSVLPKLKYNGFVCIKGSINEKWDDYIVKDKDMMTKILKVDLPLIYDGRINKKDIVKYKDSPELDP